jgi:glycosyltransferase involved in cell wall biosynthesis
MRYLNDNNKEGLSICIPTYNRLENLRETLESVLKLKELKRINYEIVISDDSRDDITERYIRRLKNNKIRYFKNRFKGQFNNLNNLINKSQKKWILFLHDDDLLASNYLQKVLPYTKSNLNIEVIWTGRVFIRNDGSKLQDYIAGKSDIGEIVRLGHTELEENILSGGFAGGHKYVGMMVTGLMAQKTLIREVGGFDPSLPVNADGLFINKVQFLASNAVYINLPLIKYRITDESERGKPSQEGVIYQEMTKIMKEILDFMKNYLTNEEYLYKRYIYEKNFYRNVLIINGPLLWTALRFKGLYLKRLGIQAVMIKDVFKKFPIVFIYPQSLLVLIVSFLPQHVLREGYKIYLKYI